ncbi:hypothetical protein JZ751_000421 [Albula glossodonta]|uniref:Uncharacterized protein n=1 Tax=Albula glossodonta TaxID=121402 RepID=A0A8T2PW66_9TELE|nr:hypothetical protein JZ751_000421 [Albula glossodonta]
MAQCFHVKGHSPLAWVAESAGTRRQAGSSVVLLMRICQHCSLLQPGNLNIGCVLAHQECLGMAVSYESHIKTCRARAAHSSQTQNVMSDSHRATRTQGES